MMNIRISLGTHIFALSIAGLIIFMIDPGKVLPNLIILAVLYPLSCALFAYLMNPYRGIGKGYPASKKLIPLYRQATEITMIRYFGYKVTRVMTPGYPSNDEEKGYDCIPSPFNYRYGYVMRGLKDYSLSEQLIIAIAQDMIVPDKYLYDRYKEVGQYQRYHFQDIENLVHKIHISTGKGYKEIKEKHIEETRRIMDYYRPTIKNVAMKLQTPNVSLNSSAVRDIVDESFVSPGPEMDIGYPRMNWKSYRKRELI